MRPGCAVAPAIANAPNIYQKHETFIECLGTNQDGGKIPAKRAFVNSGSLELIIHLIIHAAYFVYPPQLLRDAGEATRVFPQCLAKFAGDPNHGVS